MKLRIYGLIIASLFVATSCNKGVSKADNTTSSEYSAEYEAKKKTYEDQKQAQLDEKIKAQQQQLKLGAYKDYFESGKMKHNGGNFAGAIADFTSSIEIKPEFADAWGFRGISKLKSNDMDGACSDWIRAKELGYSVAESLYDQYCNP